MFYLIIYLVFFTPFKFLMTLVILLIVISMIFRFWAFLYFCVSNEDACRMASQFFLSFWGNFWTLVIIMRNVFSLWSSWGQSVQNWHRILLSTFPPSHQSQTNTHLHLPPQENKRVLFADFHRDRQNHCWVSNYTVNCSPKWGWI